MLDGKTQSSCEGDLVVLCQEGYKESQYRNKWRRKINRQLTNSG